MFTTYPSTVYTGQIHAAVKTNEKPNTGGRVGAESPGTRDVKRPVVLSA